MNTSNKIRDYLTQKNIILAAGLLASSYGLWYAFSRNRKGLSHELDKNLKCLKSVTSAEASLWHSTLSNVKYKICLSLSHGSCFHGKCTVSFDLTNIPDQLFLLFQGQEIISYKINGTNVLRSFSNLNELLIDQRIYLPSDLLKPKDNIVEIVYVGDYHQDGSGLLLQVDYDGLPYIYTNCEPFSSHTIYPCFDTMGLRSTFELTVICPKQWIAISNEKVESEISIQQAKKSPILQELGIKKSNGLKMVKFYETKPIMCYIFTVICGPFCKIDSPKIYKGIESSFYCKRSVVSKLEDQKEEISNLVYYGLHFFEEFFGAVYQFSKHDMIFCPEHLSNAMECPGAIIFCDEEFLFRDTPTESQRIRRAYITLHEMAHMWFGNQVNITWFDEIWLKESFASFFGYFALTCPELQMLFPKGWDNFELYKEPGFIWDNYQTLRHPLARGPILNSHGAEFNFDDTNYHKGSGILKVLWARLGEKTFRDVIQNYLKSNTWKSVNREAFYASLRDVLQNRQIENFSVDEYIKNWLGTEGTDKIEVQMKDFVDRIEEVHIRIHRDPPDSQRDHLFNIVLIYSDCKKEVQRIYIGGKDETVKVNFNKEQNLKAVICNYQGLDSIKVKLDDKSIKYFTQNLEEICYIDPNLETYFWRQLTLMTIDYEYSPQDLLILVKTQVENDFQGKRKAHEELINRSESTLDMRDPDLAKHLKIFVADKAYEALMSTQLTDLQQKYLGQVIENGYRFEHFEVSTKILDQMILTKPQDFPTYLNLGTTLIKTLLPYDFSKDLSSWIEHFFNATKNRCFEETRRLYEVYKQFKIDKNTFEQNATLFIDYLASPSIMSMKPKEKRLYWSLAKKKYSKIFASTQYREAYCDKLPQFYQNFYRFDAYALIEDLFPEFENGNKDAIKYLEELAAKFQGQEIILHFIQYHLDCYRFKCLNELKTL